MGSLPDYTTNAKTGFANLLMESDSFNTIKYFRTHENVAGKIEYHFAVQTAMAFDSLKTSNFLKNHPRIIDIDYKERKRNFRVFSISKILHNGIPAKEIDDKIVMIGFLGPGDEDKFFTPLNNRTPPYEPDMYGLEIIANTVAQVLE